MLILSGTGKSFIGAQVVKALYDNTKQKILVVCYTNHALDQFLQDIISVGIPLSDIVRLENAKKASAAVQSLVLQPKGQVQSSEGMLIIPSTTSKTRSAKMLRHSSNTFKC